MGIEGNIPSCTGKGKGVPRREKESKQSKDQQKLVRIGSSLYSKDTHTERKLNLCIRVKKAPGEVAFKTQSELVTTKQRTFNPVNKKLPTFSGEGVTPESNPLPPIAEDEKKE